MELERNKVRQHSNIQPVDLVIADTQVAVHVPTYHPQTSDCPHQD